MMPGKKPGLGQAEQKAHEIEADRPVTSACARDDAPGDHDARDPAARAELLSARLLGTSKMK